MTRQVKQVILFICFMLLSLSCNLLDNLSNQIDVAKGFVKSIATNVQQEQKWIQTAQAVATEVGKSNLIGTAQIISTQIGNSAFIQTVQAYVSQEAPRLLETAKVYVTQEAPRLLETGQAVVTEKGPYVIETAKALISQIPSSSGEAPSDIPLIKGEKEDLFTSEELISYTTTIKYAKVLEFYKTEMPANGWIKRDEGNVETGDVSILYYEKPNQITTITISKNATNGKTVVLINIRPQ